MATIDHARGEILFKIVYYGPGLAGKMTSIRYFHTAQPPGSQGHLVSQATEFERTLSYSFVPVTLRALGDLTVRLDLCTVPGNVFYDISRKTILKGADGVIYLADSLEYRQEANVEQLEGLTENLEAHGIDPAEVPMVFQYNKRDLDEIMPVEQMERDLNPRHRPSFASIAWKGIGVVDPLRDCVQQVIARQGGPYRGPSRT